MYWILMMIACELPVNCLWVAWEFTRNVQIADTPKTREFFSR